MQQSQRISHAERTDLSDSLMLEAAISLIVDKGTAKTTLKEVGEKAGYSRGLAGYRFGNKAGLFEFILRSVGEEWLSILKTATKGKVGFTAISSALDEHSKLCIKAPDHIRAFYILWFESIGVQSPIKDAVAGIHSRRRNDVIRWLETVKNTSSLNAEDIAEQFNASVLGIAYQWLANPQDKEIIYRLHENLKRTMQLHFV